MPCAQRRYEWFIAGTEPTTVDRSHVRIGGETVWVLPPEYAAWARENGIVQPDESPRTNGEGAAESGSSLLVLHLASPDPNRIYELDPALPASAQQVPVTAAPGAVLSRGRITLLVDGAAFANVTGPDFTAWWPLTKGRHTFAAAAISADGQQLASAPVVILVE